MADPHAPGPGHEAAEGFDRELHMRPILEVGIWTAVICIVAFVFVFFFYRWLIASVRQEEAAPSALIAAQGRQLPPEPRLQVIPERDLAAFLQEQQRELSTYGWGDREAVNG